MVPVEHALGLAASLPNCRLFIDPDEGHHFFRSSLEEILSVMIGGADGAQAAARSSAIGGRSTCSSVPQYRSDLASGPGTRRGSGPLQPPGPLQAGADGPQHRVRHRTEIAQRLVGVLADVEVDLGERVEPDQLVGVDQQSDVDAVAGHERQLLEQLARGGDLAGQRLLHRRQVRVEEVQQRSGGQLGHATAAVRHRHVARAGTDGGRSP